MDNSYKSFLRGFVQIALALFLLGCNSDRGRASLEQLSSKTYDLSPTETDFEKSVSTVINKLACEDFKDALFEGLQIQLMDTDQIPSPELLRRVILDQIELKYGRYGIPSLKDDLSSALIKFYIFLTVDVASATSSLDALSLKRQLGALLMGDHSTEESKVLQREIDLQVDHLRRIVEQYNIICAIQQVKSVFVPSVSQVTAKIAKVPLSVLGVRKAMATAYQSCNSLRLPALTQAVSPSEGIKDIGTFPGGLGRVREIVDQAALAKTHYYVKDYTPVMGCIDVKKQTMIYDFGGKPYTSSAVGASLNFWRNGGQGSSALGIDCSGFIFSSIASSGLRLAKGKTLKAHQVNDYPARMYIDASSNGFTCLEKAKMGKSLDLQAGDIVATQTHVVMIESVGRDPLAIHKYKDCSQISYKDFSFVIAQSSPEQNAIGINKYDIVEYLAQKGSDPILPGFVAYAQAACRAYRAGVDVAAGDRTFGIVRHKQTPDCLQSEIALEGFSCVRDCEELYQ